MTSLADRHTELLIVWWKGTNYAINKVLKMVQGGLKQRSNIQRQRVPMSDGTEIEQQAIC